MKKFYLITNEVKDPQGEITKKIVKYIESHGGEAVCARNEKHALMSCNTEGIDCALVLGGDGTMLRAARNMMDSDIPLLGINLGSMGYLAEVESAHVEEALDKLLRDDFSRENRMMLFGRVENTDKTEEDYALNDIVISRCGSLQILTFHIYVNGQFLSAYCADGLIVATPTGSTAYNLSAGGPIVEPGARLLLLTPICPHTLNTRSIVFAPEDEIVIRIPQGKDGGQQIVEANFDGSHKVTLRTKDRIVMRRADKTIGIIKLNTESFLSVLHKKIGEG